MIGGGADNYCSLIKLPVESDFLKFVKKIQKIAVETKKLYCFALF